MLAMQYNIGLPSNYDFGLIKERVQARHPLFDDLQGLLHKSFLWNEEDRIYAPFYVWEDNDAAQDFILNDLFRGVIKSFSRPRVRQWSICRPKAGRFSGQPRFALREADVIPGEDSLQALAEQEYTKQEDMLQHPDLAYYVVALDAERWELIRYSVWKDEASAPTPETDCVHRYTVLHVSSPSHAQPALKKASQQ